MAAKGLDSSAFEKLRLVTETMPAAVTLCNKNLEYVWVSPAYAQWLGKSREEIEGKAIREIFGQEAFDSVRHHFDEVLSGKKVDSVCQE